MKRYYYFLLLPALMLLAGCHKDEPTTPAEDRHYGRTVLMYMAMQNSLGSSGYHKADSTEVANAMAYIPEADRMLLFIDDVQRPRIYELSRELAQTNPKTGQPFGPKLVKQWTQDVSSASAATVTEVLEFMRKNYGSESYGLIMGSHATGWLPAERGTSSNYSAHRSPSTVRPRKTFGIDVGSDGSMRNDEGVAGSVADQISIEDLASAILASGVHPDFILFDACLMQNIEVDYALRRATDYIIASPISISAEGAYYTDLVQRGLFTTDPVDVARAYVAYYQGKGSIPYTDGYGTVISCVRTTQLEKLAQLMRSTLWEVQQRHGLSDVVETLKVCDMSSALNYHAYCSNYYFRPHYYDLLSAMQSLGLDAVSMRPLRQMLNEIVMFHGSTESFWIGPGYWKMQSMPESKDDWCGVSMFMPQQIYTENASRCLFGDLNEAFKATEWYKDVFAPGATY